MKNWWERLDGARKQRGWSKAELARRSGYPESRIQKWCLGKVDKPRGEVFERLGSALGVDPLWLQSGVSRDDIPQPQPVEMPDMEILFKAVHRARLADQRIKITDGEFSELVVAHYIEALEERALSNIPSRRRVVKGRRA